MPMTDQYEARLMAMTSEDYWQKLTECGWLAETPEDQHPQLKQQVEEFWGRGPLHTCFALATVQFDAECIYDSGPETSLSYYYHIELLAQASSGHFRPSDIHDELDIPARALHISFKHSNQVYRIDVPSSDWFD